MTWAAYGDHSSLPRRRGARKLGAWRAETVTPPELDAIWLPEYIPSVEQSGTCRASKAGTFRRRFSSPQHCNFSRGMRTTTFLRISRQAGGLKHAHRPGPGAFRPMGPPQEHRLEKLSLRRGSYRARPGNASAATRTPDSERRPLGRSAEPDYLECSRALTLQAATIQNVKLLSHLRVFIKHVSCAHLRLEEAMGRTGTNLGLREVHGWLLGLDRRTGFQKTGR